MSLGPPNRYIILLSHTGELLEAAAIGLLLITTLIDVVPVQPLAFITVRV